MEELLQREDRDDVGCETEKRSEGEIVAGGEGGTVTGDEGETVVGGTVIGDEEESVVRDEVERDSDTVNRRGSKRKQPQGYMYILATIYKPLQVRELRRKKNEAP